MPGLFISVFLRRSMPGVAFAIDPVANQDNLHAMDPRADISPLSHVQIRDAQPADKGTLRALSDDTHRVHRARLPHKFTPDNGYQHWLIQRALSQESPPNTGLNAMARVAHEGGKTLGYILLVWDRPPKAEDKVQAAIADIAVVPEARRCGIARALLSDADTQRALNNWHSLAADVWVDNIPSHRLFDAAGFVTERTEYTLGSPPPLHEAPTEPQGINVSWWIIPACLVLGLIIGLLL